ncbi:hypothetical protein EV356DRAFT_498095, partial [Viridothelium virens]
MALRSKASAPSFRSLGRLAGHYLASRQTKFRNSSRTISVSHYHLAASFLDSLQLQSSFIQADHVFDSLMKLCYKRLSLQALRQREKDSAKDGLSAALASYLSSNRLLCYPAKIAMRLIDAWWSHHQRRIWDQNLGQNIPDSDYYHHIDGIGTSGSSLSGVSSLL